MKTIIFDTNFLLIPVQWNVDIIEEVRKLCSFSYELAIVDKTRNELDSLDKGKTKAAVGVAKRLITMHNMKIIKTEKDKHVDTLILNYCKDNDCVVATQDARFKERLRDANIPVIILRQKSHLVAVGL